MRSRKVFSRIALPAFGGAAAAAAVIVLAGVLLVPRLCEASRDGACRPAAMQQDPGDLSTVFEVTAKEPDLAAIAPPPPTTDDQPETAAHLLDQTFGSLSSKGQAGAAPVQAPAGDPAGPQHLVVKSVPVGVDGKPLPATTPRMMTALPTPAPLVVPESEDAAITPDFGFTAHQFAEPTVAEPEAAAPVPLTRPSDLSDEAPSDATQRTVAAGGVNVRAGPSSSEARLYAIAPGETVTVVGKEGGWLKVVDDDGRTGWVDQDYIR